MHSVGATDGTLTIKTPNPIAQLLSYPWVKKLYNNNSKSLLLSKRSKLSSRVSRFVTSLILLKQLTRLWLNLRIWPFVMQHKISLIIPTTNSCAVRIYASFGFVLRWPFRAAKTSRRAKPAPLV